MDRQPSEERQTRPSESSLHGNSGHLAPQLVERFVLGLLSADAMCGIHAHTDHCERCLSAIVDAARQQASTGAPLFAAPSKRPERVGPYLLGGVLGHGGMGIVYRARHEVQGWDVALKMLRVQSAVTRARLRLEIEVLRRTRHPGVVRLFDSDARAREPWYAMELLEGETLDDRLWNVWSAARRRSRAGDEQQLTPESAGAGRLHELLACFARLCEPLAFVHAAGVVHGDLKPANIYLRNGSEPVLVDFGLVSPAGGAIGRERLHVAGRVVGTAAYVAPEVIAGKVVDARADLYALGCLLYEAVTGRPPFWGMSTDAILKQHWDAPIVPPSARVSGVSRELDALICSLLEKDPARRLGHAFDVAAALNALSPVVARSSARPVAEVLYRPRMVGRAREQSQFAGYLREAANGDAVFGLIGGESGIGKSFLTTELCRAAVLEGFQVVAGECSPLSPTGGGPGSAPLQAFRPFLELVSDTCREPGNEELAQRLLPELRALAAYEGGLQGLLDGPLPALPAFASRERVIRALTDLVASWSEHEPLLLALDDLQWADDLSLAALDTLSDEPARHRKLLVIGTYRSDEAGVGIARIAEKPWVRHTVLQRLSRDEVSEIVSGLLALREPPPSVVVGFVHHHSEGVPFFVAEYVRALAAEGLLHREYGRWLLGVGSHDSQAAFAAVSFPTELAQLVQRRLSGLDPALTEVLECAAVLGRTFDAETLAHALQEPVASLGPRLRELELRHVLACVGAERYGFLHDKIRESVYAGIARARRQRLHLSAALALEAQRRSDAYAALAHHYREAGDVARAIGCFEAAAAQALRLSAAADALRQLRELAGLVERLSTPPSSLRRARWERMTADAYQGLGCVRESEAPLSRAAELLGCPVPQRELLLSARLVPAIARQVARRLRAARAPEPRDRDLSLERARVFDRLQRVYYFKGHNTALLFANVSSLNGSQLPTPELAIACGFTAAVMDIFVHSRRLAELYFELGREMLPRIQDAGAESNLHMLFALYHLGHGRFDDGVPWADQAIEVARSSGFFRRLAEALAVRAGLELMRGQHRRAEPYLAELAEVTSKREDVQMLAWSVLQRAHALCLAGERASAGALLAQLPPHYAKLSRPERIWLHGLSCYVDYHEGNFEAAERHQSDGMDLIALGPTCHSGCLDAYGKLAEIGVALHLRGATHGTVAAERGCAMLVGAARSFPVLVPVARLHSAALARARGDEARAQRLLRSGLLGARRLGSSFDQARLRLALAAGLPEGPERRFHEATAQRIIAELAGAKSPSTCRN